MAKDPQHEPRPAREQQRIQHDVEEPVRERLVGQPELHDRHRHVGGDGQRKQEPRDRQVLRAAAPEYDIDKDPEKLLHVSNAAPWVARFYTQVHPRMRDATLVTRPDELEAAVRTVGEPNFTRPLNEVSFGKLLFDLFHVAHRFQLTLQPQLLMLQKTLLNIEGLGRQLDPELDIWSVAKPELETILRERHNLENMSQELRERLPGWLAEAPEIPGLVHDFLVKANSGQLLTRTASEDAARTRQQQLAAHQKILHALAGGALAIPGAILVALETGPWLLWGYSTPGVILLALGGWQIFRALK